MNLEFLSRFFVFKLKFSVVVALELQKKFYFKKIKIFFFFYEIFIKNSRQRAAVLFSWRQLASAYVSLRQLTSEIQSRVNHCSFKFKIWNYKNISFFREWLWTFIRVHSWTFVNDYEWLWMIMNVHEWTEGSWRFTNKNIGNFWMTRIVSPLAFF